MAAVLGTTPVIAAAQEADNGISKEETVYVNATAEGEIKDITVSDWLKNSGSAEGDVSDVSDLEGIKNVKGDETFTPVSYTHLDVYKRQAYKYPKKMEKHFLEDNIQIGFQEYSLLSLFQKSDLYSCLLYTSSYRKGTGEEDENTGSHKE